MSEINENMTDFHYVHKTNQSNLELVKWIFIITLPILIFSHNVEKTLLTGFVDCDIHITITSFDNYWEPLTEKPFFKQPRTIFNYKEKQKEIHRENQRFVSISKETCDLNVIILESLIFLNKIFRDSLLKSYRGSRSLSTFIFVIQDQNLSANNFQELLPDLQTYNAMIFLYARIPEYRSHFETYLPSASWDRFHVLRNYDDIVRRNYITHGFDRKLFYSHNNEKGIINFDNKCSQSLYGYVKAEYKCMFRENLFATLGIYKNVTFISVNAPEYQGSRSEEMCGKVTSLNAVYAENLTFWPGKKFVQSNFFSAYAYYCDSLDINTDFRSSVFIWFEYAFDKTTWWLILGSLVALWVYLQIYNLTLNYQNVKKSNFSWLSTLSLLFGKNHDNLKNKLFIMFSLSSLIIVSIYLCFVKNDAIQPPVKHLILNLSELIRKNYKIPIIDLGKKNLTLHFVQIAILNLASKKYNLTLESYAMNVTNTNINEIKIAMNRKEKGMGSNYWATFKKIINGDFNLERNKPKLFSMCFKTGSDYEFGSLIDTSLRCNKVNDPFYEANSFLYVFTRCFGEILQRGMTVLTETGFRSNMRNIGYIARYKAVEKENMKERYNERTLKSARLSTRMHTSFSILVGLLSFATNIFLLEIFLYKFWPKNMERDIYVCIRERIYKISTALLMQYYNCKLLLFTTLPQRIKQWKCRLKLCMCKKLMFWRRKQ